MSDKTIVCAVPFSNHSAHLVPVKGWGLVRWSPRLTRVTEPHGTLCRADTAHGSPPPGSGSDGQSARATCPLTDWSIARWGVRDKPGGCWGPRPASPPGRSEVWPWRAVTLQPCFSHPSRAAWPGPPLGATHPHPRTCRPRRSPASSLPQHGASLSPAPRGE